MTGARLVLRCLPSLLLPALASAQSVRGAVIDRGTNAALPGVVVLLLDSAGTTVARGLTNERGEYRLSASSTGTYRVRTLRIGFRPVTSDPVVLPPGDEARQDLLVAAVPFTLDTVRVVGRNACRAIGDSGTFVIWEQVRTALIAAQLTARVRNVEATLVSYERKLEMDLRTIREQSSGIQSGFVTQPWRSASPDRLRRVGYVVTDAANLITYHGPDLEVLLSDMFLEDHCFRLERSRDPTRLGIAFEPNRERRGVAEIRGTLWLDRRSSELRSMEFRYVNVTSDQEQWARGDLEFVRMRNGGWAISRWSIQMPLVELRRVYGSSGGMEPKVSEIRVAGGDLALVVRGSDTLWSRPPIVLAGTVMDSASGTPVAGARIALRGTSLGGTTNDAGQFSVAGVLPGQYTLEVQTPALESVNAVHQAPLVLTDDAPPVQIRVPNAAQIVGAVCGSRRTAKEGIVIGRVSAAGDSMPVQNAKIIAEWTELSVRKEGVAIVTGRQSRWLEGRTDARGQFRICGVPLNTDILVRGQSDSGSAAPIPVRITKGRFARADLVVDKQVAHGAIAGVVLADSTRQPIADAEVLLPELAKSVFTNERGGFLLSEIPAGEHQLVVRRLGYGALTVRVAFAANQTVQREIVLTKAEKR